MLRRDVIASLLASGSWARAQAGDKLGAFFPGAHGTAVLVDVQARRLLAVHAAELASRVLAPPGSTVKPFAITALMEAGKLRAVDSFRCPRALEIGGRVLTCTHPPDLPPMTARTAIAYSCNCFVAQYAARLERGELARTLARYGMLSRTEWFAAEEAPGESPAADVRLQALGEDGVLVTAAGLAAAYRRLALNMGRPAMAPILGGLEDAVAYGTAQRGHVDGLAVAGKTGSVVAPDGAHLAWFAGFAPSRKPSVAVVVMLQGRSGGADAAPIAGRILEAHARGTL